MPLKEASTAIDLSELSGNNYPGVEDSCVIVKEKGCTGFSSVGKLGPEAVPRSHRKDFKAMAARRFQAPSPELIGHWWYIRVRQDVNEDGVLRRKLNRIRVAPEGTPVRQVKRKAVEMLRPMNQNLTPPITGQLFREFVETTYIPEAMPFLRKPTRDRYLGVIDNFLLPEFGGKMLGELNFSVLQRYFVTLDPALSYESRDKVRDVLASILKAAIQRKDLIENPLTGVRIVHNKRAGIVKPVLEVEEFFKLLGFMLEPYATIAMTAVFAGLRASEWAGLKRHCVSPGMISVQERYCRGDWDVPKSATSIRNIEVPQFVTDRIRALDDLVVSVRAGLATRHFKAVKDTSPDALVFQSVQNGGPMSEQNLLRRHLRPAGEKAGLKVNWLILRRSYLNWMGDSGADPKDMQAQMGHSRTATTMDVYRQFHREGQRRAVRLLEEFVTNRVTHLSQKTALQSGQSLNEVTTIQ